jgi:hypothetical protein
MQIDVEQFGLLAPFVGLALAQGDHLAEDFDVVAQGLGFGVAVLDVVGDAGLVLLQPFDPVDETRSCWR